MTPAYGVKHWAELHIQRLSEIDSVSLARKIADKSVSTIARDGINSKNLMYHRVPTESEIEEIRVHVSAVVVHGRITYRDVFRRERFTDYRLQYTGMWPPVHNAVMTFSDKGNSAD
jgi:hypothetical protein